MNKRLELAKAVYPGHAWEAGPNVFVGSDYFDPENNPSQAWDVLAWLLKQSAVDFSRYSVSDNEYGTSEVIGYHRHDCTASGLIGAVVQAAERCV